MMLPENKNLSVLVVDDEEHICDLLEVMFKSFNIFSSIVSSTSGNVAVQKIRNQDFDLIILDNHMPDKQGIEILDSLYSQIGKKNYKVILMSGALQNDHAVKCIKMGVRNFLIKPFTRKGLLKAVIKALN